MDRNTRTLSVIIVDLDGSGDLSATVAYSQGEPGKFDTRVRLDLALETPATDLTEWATRALATILNEL